jgi:hypothetical protein
MHKLFQMTNSMGTTYVRKTSGATSDWSSACSQQRAFDSEGFISFFTDTPVVQFGNFERVFD